MSRAIRFLPVWVLAVPTHILFTWCQLCSLYLSFIENLLKLQIFHLSIFIKSCVFINLRINVIKSKSNISLLTVCLWIKTILITPQFADFLLHLVGFYIWLFVVWLSPFSFLIFLSTSHSNALRPDKFVLKTDLFIFRFHLYLSKRSFIIFHK